MRMIHMKTKEPSEYFEKCTECNNDTFRIKIIPFGDCGTDNQFYCVACGEHVGGIYHDPLGEGDYGEWGEDERRVDTTSS